MSKPEAIPSKVSDFYHGRSIFVTGATGFVGKVLLHKLLDSSPGIKNLYVLIRPKRGLQPRERLQTMLKTSEIFLRMDDLLLNKIVPVAGDITHPRLGMSDDDRDQLVRDVSVIFHTAATVKFDEEFSKSVVMNVQGTLSVLQLGHKMGDNLKSFVHVSTAYSHCYLRDDEPIDEKFYGCGDTDPQAIIDMCRDKPAEVLNLPETTKMLIGKHPNTYTFTKALAEQIVKDNAHNLPVAIFRPSIIVASIKEPLPGWIDNLNGPTGLFAGAASGILRSVFCKRDKKADFMPVDVAINLMCVVGWKTANDAANLEIPIYNCTSGASSPITWGQAEAIGLNYMAKYPVEQAIWWPGGSFKNSKAADRICRVIYHFLPAILIDLVLRAAGKKPFMWKIVAKMTKAENAMEYFATREWSWSNCNAHLLQDDLDEGDRSIYYCDLKNLPDWDEYFRTYMLGIRHFLLKNDPESIDRCRRKVRILGFLHWSLHAFLLFLFYKFVAMILM